MLEQNSAFIVLLGQKIMFKIRLKINLSICFKNFCGKQLDLFKQKGIFL